MTLALAVFTEYKLIDNGNSFTPDVIAYKRIARYISVSTNTLIAKMFCTLPILRIPIEFIAR